jgi:hypothetical protein
MADRQLTAIERAALAALSSTSVKAGGRAAPLGKGGPLDAIRKSAKRMARRHRKAQASTTSPIIGITGDADPDLPD